MPVTILGISPNKVLRASSIFNRKYLKCLKLLPLHPFGTYLIFSICIKGIQEYIYRKHRLLRSIECEGKNMCFWVGSVSNIVGKGGQNMSSFINR